jgi:hypothetical protein
MVSFFLGFAVACVFCLLVPTRDQWLELPRVWQDEPDCRLRGWLRQLRRLTGRGRIARCSGCGGIHFLTTQPSNAEVVEGEDTWEGLGFGRGPSHQAAAAGDLQWHVERIADDVVGWSTEVSMLLFFDVEGPRTFRAKVNDELPEFEVVFSKDFNTAKLSWKTAESSHETVVDASTYSVAEALVEKYVEARSHV